ncbi:MAG TPA: polysaccharide deacetylase family protein [Chloroflexota bacterium]|nr:polysaccharide deacetylase family protein [Chloroflexota bacterium]
MTLNRPVFILSVDFELLWGYVLHPKDRAVSLLLRDETQGRSSALALLKILDRHGLPATWATVGSLFLDPDHTHPGRPDAVQVGLLGPADPQLFHAPEVIEAIRRSPTGHEIAYHSFSHVRFSECTPEIARRELTAGVRVAAECGLRFRSFVFPENKLGHTALLKQAGFLIYRGRNLGGRGVGQGLGARMTSLVTRRITAPAVAPIWREGLWEVPGSMLFGDYLRPCTVVARARRGLRAALRHNMIFHPWLHPQDLLLDPGLAWKLDTFLALVAQKRARGELAVLTMGELATVLTREGLRRSLSSLALAPAAGIADQVPVAD